MSDVPLGRCPACGNKRSLGADGLLTFHEAVTTDTDGIHDECPGAGQPPAATDHQHSPEFLEAQRDAAGRGLMTGQNALPSRYVTTRIGLIEALRDLPSPPPGDVAALADSLLERLPPVTARAAEDPRMVLLEDAWTLICELAAGGHQGVAGEVSSWRERYEQAVREHAGQLAAKASAPKACICPRFPDTGGCRVGDLTCPVHGVNGTEPLDGPWEAEAGQVHP